jgi:beta-lactamase class D
MRIKRQSILLLILIAFGLSTCKQQQTTETRNDFKKFYDQYKVDGSFVLYDQSNDKYIFYNQSQFKQPFTPASTFKICNSLIGLETGVIKDENFIIPWDSITRRIPAWNKDQNLRTAFKNSTVWYYQQLARRVGGEEMKYWLDKANYGNADTSGGIDKFWLSGDLRISPEQQIDFLRRLHDNNLPFSQRSIDIVKNIMIAKDTLGYVVRAKTGWGEQDDKEIGWYVGYVEKADDVYYFANCIQTANSENKDFARARIEIVYQILDELKLIRK